MFGINTCFKKISKFYNKFRTCTSSLIHCYISLKPIQNISKIIWSSKIPSLNCLRQKPVDRSIDRCPLQARMVDREVDRAFGQGRARMCTLSVDRLGDRLRDPNSQLGSVDRQFKIFFLYNERSTARSIGANDSILDDLRVYRPVNRHAARWP